MTEQNEKEWLALKNEFIVVYRKGDNYKTIVSTADNAVQFLNYLVKENELTAESILSVTKCERIKRYE